MTSQRPKDLIRDNLSIPTLPAVVQRISQMIANPENGTAEVGAVVGEDAPLAAKVLRIANSAFYGLHERCLSTEQASAVLGLRVLKNVVTQAAVIHQFKHLEAYGEFDINEIWRHSSMVAHACSLLAERCTGKLGLAPSEFHVCGLLHDLGKVVMLDSLGERYLDIYRQSQREELPLHALELDEFGFNHTDVGSLVASHWSLPKEVSGAIQFHHGPREAVSDDPIVCLVAHANLICHRLDKDQFEAAEAALDPPTLEFLGLDPKLVPELLNDILSACSEEAV